MSLSVIPSLDKPRTRERRSRSREPLPSVVLVFFENQNWGKLIEMNEDGMSFEFAHLPALRRRIDFTFEAMGSEPMPVAGTDPDEAFQATGEILWTREFERIAGVRFVGMAKTQRWQIRQWLSCKKPVAETAPNQEVKQGPEAVAAGPSESPRPQSETVIKEKEEELEPALEDQDSIAGPRRESGPPHATGFPVAEPMESSRLSASSEHRQLSVRDGSNPALTRLAVLGLAAIAVAFAASARMILSKDRSAGAHSRAAAQLVAEEPADLVSTAVESTRPLQVEVVDVRGRRWVLWFPSDGARSVRASASASALTPADEGSHEKTGPALDYTVTNNVARPKKSEPAAALAPAEVLPLSGELSAPLGESIGSSSASPVAPAPEIKTPQPKSNVQEARLSKSVPPEYPELAKSAHVSGDVVMDALIDPYGNVTSLKVISGPPLLHRAAVNALRQWKYEPARLDGQPVAVHLAVTLNFHLD